METSIPARDADAVARRALRIKCTEQLNYLQRPAKAYRLKSSPTAREHVLDPSRSTAANLGVIGTRTGDWNASVLLGARVIVGLPFPGAVGQHVCRRQRVGSGRDSGRL